jgi:uncharacterized tellurite resistance protein B-like protein
MSSTPPKAPPSHVFWASGFICPRKLFQAAESAKHESLELFGFVRKIVRALDEDQRVEIIEMLWEVAYADGVLDAHEDAMIRKVAGLLYVSDFNRGAARRRVREKLGLTA